MALKAHCPRCQGLLDPLDFAETREPDNLLLCPSCPHPYNRWKVLGLDLMRYDEYLEDYSETDASDA